MFDGATPPANLAGQYSVEGVVSNTSDALSNLKGLPVNSTFILSNQTNSGRIDCAEMVGGIKATGSGGYVTGANGNFTIYQESKQSGTEAGLPAGVSITVVLIMSGQQANNGDLTNVKGISIVTEVNNRDYNTLIGQWWKWVADFYLE